MNGGPAAKDLFQALATRMGRYAGEGVDHEGRKFLGRFELAPIVEGRGALITFVATGLDGTIHHREVTLIGHAPEGGPALWILSTLATGVVRHDLRRDAAMDGTERTLVFGAGDPDDPGAFRCEIEIDLWWGGDVGYRVSWGKAGEAFAPRSWVRLRPVARS